MTRSVWTKKFIRTVADYMHEGKTRAEISELLGLTTMALQVGTSRYKKEIVRAMKRHKPTVVEQPAVVEEEITIDGTYKTLDLNFHVRLYAIDGYSDFPVHGAIRSPRGWESCSWTKTGHFSKDGSRHIYDLVKTLPDEKCIWVWQNHKGERKTFLTEYDAEDFKKIQWGWIYKLSLPV